MTATRTKIVTCCVTGFALMLGEAAAAAAAAETLTNDDSLSISPAIVICDTCYAFISISPPTGTYYSTQDFDLVVRVESNVSPIGASIKYNGIEVAGDLASCWKVGMTDSGDSTYRCPLEGNMLGEGDNTLVVKVNFSLGTVATSSVVWTVKHVYE